MGDNSLWEWGPLAPRFRLTHTLGQGLVLPVGENERLEGEMGLERAPCVPTPAGAGLGTRGLRDHGRHAHSPPFSRPRFPHVRCLRGRGAGVYPDPTPPPSRQLGPRSPGSCAGTSRVGRPAQPPGNRLQRTWRAHTLIDTAPGLGEGGVGGWGGGTAEELGFGKPSLHQSRTKASARQLPSPGDKGSGGRMSHPHCPPALSRPRARGAGRGAALTRPR